jgi:hypothetical protein
MAEIDDVRSQLEQAISAGDDATAQRLSTRYRDLQAQTGQLPTVGRGFVAQNGREYQLATRVLTLRRAGRDEEARNLTRIIARERFANQITRDGRGQGEAALFGANRGVLNLGTLASGAAELVEDTVGGNRNGLTAREKMEDFSAAQDIVRGRRPVAAAAGEVGGTVLSLAAPGGAAARATQGASRAGRVVSAAAQGATFGAAQGASDAFVRNEDVGEGAIDGANTGAVAGGALSIFGQAASPVVRALANRVADSQGLRLLAEHINPSQLNSIVLATRQYVRQFGRQPTLAEAAGMADATIAREAGQIVESRVPASQVAQQGAARVRTQAQRNLAEAVMPRSSASNSVTSDATTAAMQGVAGSALVARPGTPVRDWLVSPDVMRVIRRLPPSRRQLFDDAIVHNGAVTVRMLDDLRQQVGNIERLTGADRAWTDLANTARGFADQASNNAYSRILREHGQNALREEIANSALRSPAAAQETAADLAESAKRARDLTAELGPAEATRIRNAGSSVQRALRGVDEFEPRNALSRGEEAANNVGEGARAALLSKTGGAGIAAFIARNVRRLGISPQEAEQFARDFTDPSQTQRAIAFLQQRIGQGPTNRYLAALEQAGIRPTTERVAAAGARTASRGDVPEQPTTEELVSDQPSVEQTALPQAAEFDPEQVELSSITQDYLDRAAQLEGSDDDASSYLYEVGTRLADLERRMMQAAVAGDEVTARALAEQRQRIINNEQ